MSPLASRSPRTRRLARLGLGAVAGLAAVLLAGTAASAHVRVDGGSSTQGGYGVLTFRVPTESDTAATVGLTVTFPSDTPIASVSTQPKTGWTATVTTAALETPVQTDDGTLDTYVSSVTWTADSEADGIQPGEYDTFSVLAGPLPDQETVVLPASQVYSDGTTVDWNEQATGDAEPEHPAPVLSLPAAADTAAVAATATPEAAATTADEGTGGAAWTGIVGLIAGVLGLIVGGVALARSGRTPSST